METYLFVALSCPSLTTEEREVFCICDDIDALAYWEDEED